MINFDNKRFLMEKYLSKYYLTCNIAAFWREHFVLNSLYIGTFLVKSIVFNANQKLLYRLKLLIEIEPQNNSKFDFQKLLFSSSHQKITFWTTFGRVFLPHDCLAIHPLGAWSKGDQLQNTEFGGHKISVNPYP